VKVVELFAGIGGFRLGLERTGHNVIYSNEFLEKPRSIYEFQFKEKPDGRDIYTIPERDVPDADLLCGGFPCATFSVAGKRSGFSKEDTRGTLFFEICRIIQFKRIPYIFLENVKGLLNHDGGRTFNVILAALDELGYDCQWQVCNSRCFGIPQNRERVFIVGNLRHKPRPKVFPIRATNKTFTELRRESSEKNEGQGRGSEETATAKAKDESVVDLNIFTKRFSRLEKRNPEYSPTLEASMGGGATEMFLSYYHKDKDINKVAFQNHWNQEIRTFEDSCPTILASWKNSNHLPFVAGLHDKNIILRKITPIECERLQGLPDNFTKHYHDGSIVKDSERYERCGRTVTIPIIEEIGRRLHEFY